MSSLLVYMFNDFRSLFQAFQGFRPAHLFLCLKTERKKQVLMEFTALKNKDLTFKRAKVIFVVMLYAGWLFLSTFCMFRFKK